MNINAENKEENKIHLDDILHTDDNGTTNNHENKKRESKIKLYDIPRDNSSMAFNYRIKNIYILKCDVPFNFLSLCNVTIYFLSRYHNYDYFYHFE
jgi:hypothetical protein